MGSKQYISPLSPTISHIQPARRQPEEKKENPPGAREPLANRSCKCDFTTERTPKPAPNQGAFPKKKMAKSRRPVVKSGPILPPKV